MSDNKMSDNKMSDNKMSDNKMSDNKMSDNKMSDNKMSSPVRSGSNKPDNGKPGSGNDRSRRADDGRAKSGTRRSTDRTESTDRANTTDRSLKNGSPKSPDGSYRLGGDSAPKGDRVNAKQRAEDQTVGRTGTKTVKVTEMATGRPSRPATRSRSRSNKVGGVAPFVPPKGRLSRRMRAREWGRRGFVQLSPGRQKLRHRILPRTVIGISFMLLAAGVGAGFSGAVFYAYYDDRLAENERAVARFVEGFDQQFTDASGALDEMRTESVSTIRSELAPLEDYVDNARGVINLPVMAGPSVWLVETRDEQGRAATGSAFAIVGHQGGTALITSHALVTASTASPGPGIALVKGSERIPARLWAWDEQRDLALLVVDRQIPILTMAGNNAQIQAVGGSVFAMSGFGGQGATASPGTLLDQSQIGLQHTAPIGTMFAGGPLLDGQGRVVGMASTAYSPLGLDPGDVRQAPDIAAICAKILRCSEVDNELSAESADG